MSFAARRLLVVVFVSSLAATHVAQAQITCTWSGLALPDNNWTTLGNWNTGVPATGDTALFSGSGNTNTSISLGAASRSIKTIQFDGAVATPYTLGILASGDKFNFDAGGQMIVASNIAVLQTINAAIQANGALTVTNSGSVGLSLAGNVNFASAGTLTVSNAVANTTTTLGGNISDAAGQPGSLSLLATTTGVSNNNNFIINGTNTYTGPTTIQVNTGSSGSIQIGSNSPFGTGQVSITQVGTLAQQFSALGGTRTIGNAIRLNSGMTYTGSDSFAFTGPITIINSIAGGTRSFSNSITSAGKTVTLGASPSSSTITLGDPLVIGGAIGKTAIFAPSAGATTIINDVMQDPGTGGGTASGGVQYAGSAGGVSQINGANTYTGSTVLNGSSTIKIGSDYNVGGTSGPFGLGTLTLNNSTNNILEPIGGSRTVANPVSMIFGLTVANDFADTSSLTLTGPITLGTTGRLITNNFAANGGTLTLGAAASPSTFTLPTNTAQTLTFAGTGTTVINDVIQNSPAAPSPATSILYSTSGPVALNAQNTYTGNTSLTGTNANFRIGANSNGLPGPSFTAGPFGTGTVSLDSAAPTFEPIGADRTIANAITMNFGFIAANATAGEDPTGNHNLTLTGPITLGTTGRLITNNFAANGGTLTLGAAASPSTFTLPTNTAQTLTFAGTGTTVINDVIQNSPAAPSPATSILYSTSGPVALNAQNTYTGNTSLTGTNANFRIGANSNGLPGPSFTAGPFGTGTVSLDSAAPTFEPIGADRTIANAITMNFGFIAANATAGEDPTGNHNLSLTGPMTLGATSRILTNNLASGVALTLGSAATPSTISLGSTLSIRTQIAGGGSTIINDAVSGVGGLTIQDSAVVQLNGASSYAGTTSVTGTGTPKLFVNGAKTGTGAVTVDSVGTLGGTGSIAGDIANSGKIAPGNSVGTLTATGNVVMNPNSHLVIELSGGSADKLVVGGNLNLSNVDFLDVTGAGQGLSWVIATYTGTRTGTFDNVTSGYTVSYGNATNGQITLNKAASGVNGDFNNDGKVDALDYVTWRKNNTTSNAMPNDNGLGTPIGPAHYTLWRSNFGNPPGSGSGELWAGATVPEPASLLLVLVAILGFSAVRTRRRIAT